MGKKNNDEDEDEKPVRLDKIKSDDERMDRLGKEKLAAEEKLRRAIEEED